MEGGDAAEEPAADVQADVSPAGIVEEPASVQQAEVPANTAADVELLNDVLDQIPAGNQEEAAAVIQDVLGEPRDQDDDERDIEECAGDGLAVPRVKSRLI